MDLVPGNERGPRGGRALAQDTITPRSIADFADTRAATREWLKKHGPALLGSLDAMSRAGRSAELALVVGEAVAALKAGHGPDALRRLAHALDRAAALSHEVGS